LREDVAKELEKLRPAFEGAVKPPAESLALGGMAILRIANLAPSRGFEPLLIENRYNPIVARGVSYLATRFGRREESESKRRRRVFDAIRFLANPRRKSAILARARTILTAWDQTSIVETAFVGAGLSEHEFIAVLKAFVGGDKVNQQRLTEIAAQVAPSLVIPRGPKVTAASASHEFLLEHKLELAQRRPHSRRDRAAENCDALTEATRVEFGDPHFDSRPAKRRSRRRKHAVKG
jgi:hypothetical protein